MAGSELVKSKKFLKSSPDVEIQMDFNPTQFNSIFIFDHVEKWLNSHTDYDHRLFHFSQNDQC